MVLVGLTVLEDVDLFMLLVVEVNFNEVDD